MAGRIAEPSASIHINREGQSACVGQNNPAFIVRIGPLQASVGMETQRDTSDTEQLLQYTCFNLQNVFDVGQGTPRQKDDLSLSQVDPVRLVPSRIKHGRQREDAQINQI